MHIISGKLTEHSFDCMTVRLVPGEEVELHMKFFLRLWLVARPGWQIKDRILRCGHWPCQAHNVWFDRRETSKARVVWKENTTIVRLYLF